MGLLQTDDVVDAAAAVDDDAAIVAYFFCAVAAAAAAVAVAAANSRTSLPQTWLTPRQLQHLLARAIGTQQAQHYLDAREVELRVRFGWRMLFVGRGGSGFVVMGCPKTAAAMEAHHVQGRMGCAVAFDCRGFALSGTMCHTWLQMKEQLH